MGTRVLLLYQLTRTPLRCNDTVTHGGFLMSREGESSTNVGTDWYQLWTIHSPVWGHISSRGRRGRQDGSVVQSKNSTPFWSCKNPSSEDERRSRDEERRYPSPSWLTQHSDLPTYLSPPSVDGRRGSQTGRGRRKQPTWEGPSETGIPILPDSNM